ncbi:MAG: GNAT family N-acetyltransferase [Prevotellaceae bacterium]|jgi:GNAT superfamily N-acetyltransferase|nr:GNAT family N-acetyltransferase [Prevotellaceae bacterium]
MKIRKYDVSDQDRLVGMFALNLKTNKSYISHGEIQMGLLYGDGQTLALDFKEKWQRYLNRHHDNPQSFIYVIEDDRIVVGFVIFGIEDDYDKDYGIIYDILLADDYRGKGAGDKLFQTAIEVLKDKGINNCYLESGLSNHSAHAFFEKKGFKHISNIYRLTTII